MTRAGCRRALVAVLVVCWVGSACANKPNPPRKGGYYLDDGPADFSPSQLELISDAEPRPEPLHRFANNPYTVFGVDYTPMRALTPFRQRGIGSWYGRRFHGQRTSSGEPYDMFGMTAAHPTLPIPSYARVTNVATGRSVVVRINDRGPFHAGRVIDLSFTAARKLGYANNGSTQVEVESIVNDTLLLASQASALPVKGEPDPIAQLILNDPRGVAALSASTSATSPTPAATAATAATSATALPVVTEPRGVFLQLAAFNNRDNADSFRLHLERELGALSDKLVLHIIEGRYRLRLGPYANAAEARRMAERVREMLDVKPMMVSY